MFKMTTGHSNYQPYTTYKQYYRTQQIWCRGVIRYQVNSFYFLRS